MARHCRIPDCDSPVRQMNFCYPHYNRWLRYGDPFSLYPVGPSAMGRRPAAERFASFVVVSPNNSFRGTPCHEWTGAHDQNGYSKFQLERGRPVAAHRFAYQLEVSELGPAVVLDHLCRNVGCVNPDHLEPVSQAENIRRGLWGIHNAEQRARTHCHAGHEFTPENTADNGKGGRACRICRAGYNRAYRLRKKEAA